MMSRVSFTFFTVLLIVVAGCGSPPSINSEGEVSFNEEEFSSNSDGGGIPVNTGPAPKVENYGQAPDTFRAKFETSKGDFTIEVTRAWSPVGADRFYNLVKNNFYDGCCFFRVIDGFMAQVGINGNPEIHAQWKDRNIVDDPVVESNQRGFVTFANTGSPNTRSAQFFINFRNNANLDRMYFSPFGKVIEGMKVVGNLYSGYGDGPPRGSGPNQDEMQKNGNAYLQQSFPKLDYIKKATVIEDAAANEKASSAADNKEN